ncbi:MAG: biotin carboxylase [Nocardioides sp.]
MANEENPPNESAAAESTPEVTTAKPSRKRAAPAKKVAAKKAPAKKAPAKTAAKTAAKTEAKTEAKAGAETAAKTAAGAGAKKAPVARKVAPAKSSATAAALVDVGAKGGGTISGGATGGAIKGGAIKGGSTSPEGGAAGFAGAAPSVSGRKLRNISEIRTFFRTNETPIFFLGPTAFNLLGLDRWVRNFSFITYYDSWDGYHPRVFSPVEIEHAPFTSGEDINNYLLTHPAVQAHIAAQIRNEGDRPKVVMVFFDEETERICEEQGYDLILPTHALRTYLDSKITTTRLGEEAGASSVPNVLTTVSSWTDLMKQARAAKLGKDLVIQTAYGDSGKTTYFVASRDDWNKCATDVVGEEIKVMKRIRNRAAAVEAVNTRHGTIVGPFMTDLTGYKELTPYRGGWCGNDLYPGALNDDQRARAIEHVRKLGDRLREEGYRGFFEVDVLVDLDDDEVYLGELNPRISGASSMTNVTAGAYADVPLFLFHLLEYLGVDYDIDVDEINERWRELASVDVWSQLIMKTSTKEVRFIDKAPKTGIYRVKSDGSLEYQRNTLDWHYLSEGDEAFFLRVYGEGNYLFKGADIGILVSKSRMQTDKNQLTERCRTYIDGIHAQYETSPVEVKPKPANLLAYLK